MEFLIPIFITGFAFAFLAWVAYVILDILRTRQRVRATSELQAKLIDRLGAQDIGVSYTETGDRAGPRGQAESRRRPAAD